MQIRIKETNITLSPNIKKYIEEKISPIEKFLETSSEMKADFEIEKLPHHKKGKVFRAEVNVLLGGKLFRAEALKEDLYQAIVEVKDLLQREFKKFKGKRREEIEKGGREVRKKEAE